MNLDKEKVKRFIKDNKGTLILGGLLITAYFWGYKKGVNKLQPFTGAINIELTDEELKVVDRFMDAMNKQKLLVCKRR